MRLPVTLIALAALALPTTAAAQAPDPCAGIADCVVAPASPVVVLVDGSTLFNDPRNGTAVSFWGGSAGQRSIWYVPNPTPYTVTCPAGRVAARTSASSTAGTVWGMSPGLYGLPTTNGNNAPLAPAITATAVVPTVAIAAGGSGPGAGGGDALTPSVRFSTTIGADLLGALREADRDLAPTKKTAALQWAWFPTPLPTYTPSVACIPDVGAVRARRAGAPQQAAHTHHRHHHRETTVRRGAQRHWTRCPAGFRRIGPVSHAFVVENRTSLTRREINALRAEHGPGRNHIVTRTGKHAPAGAKLQIHATCVRR